MKLLCAIGMHRRVVTTEFLPSITAAVVTEFKTEVKCSRCGKRLYFDHLLWDGEEFVRAEGSPENNK